MARKRYQRGALVQESGKWILRWRQDVVDANGNVSRRERQAMVGSLDDLPTKRTARRIADRMIDQLGINAADYRPGRVATVGEFAITYERDVLPTLKPSANESYRSAYRCYIEPVLADYRLDEIKGQIPQQVVSFMLDKRLARKTILNALTTLASMLNAARDWDYMAAKLDWEKLRLPPKPAKKEERYFTPEESQAIIDAAPMPWNVCFAFMAYLGIRCGEAVGIAWQHLDLERGVLMVRQSNWRGRLLDVKSNDSRRNLPMPDQLVQMLVDYYPHRRASEQGLLFPNLKGQPITSCHVRRDILHPIREKLGIPRGAFHAFRHGHATAMFEDGNASPAVVKASMGHAHLATTMNYTHLVSAEHRAAIERTTAAFLRRGSEPVPPAPVREMVLRGSAGNSPAKLVRIK